jgi:hypothetical protein
VGALSQESWLEFVGRCESEYTSAVARYGSATETVLAALAGVGESETPQEAVARYSEAVGAVAESLGPAGGIAADIYRTLVKVAQWLVDTWPAVPVYNNTDALLRVAGALGYPQTSDGVLQLSKAGWICGNGKIPTGARRADGTLTFPTPRDAMAWFLMPQLDRPSDIPSDQSWGLGLARADACIAGGSRFVGYQSQVSERKRYSALCIKVDSLPALSSGDDLKRKLRLFIPLSLALEPLVVPEGALPDWFPREDRALSKLTRMAHGALDWTDAPVQSVGGGPFLARKIAGEIARAAGAAPFATTLRPTHSVRQPGGGGGLIALAAAAALTLL